jgi:hypothetical protein
MLTSSLQRRLDRLPSLDLAELDSLSAVPGDAAPLIDRSNGNGTVPFGAPMRSAGAQFAQLLRRPYAGAALGGESRGNSFDLAASAVTAPSVPSVLRQGSFDASYLLPLPGPPDASSSSSNPAEAPSGRVYLQAGGGIAGLDRPSSNGSGSSSIFTGGPLAGTSLSRPPLHSPAAGDGMVPLLRQRTFDYSAPQPVGSAAEADLGSGKRKLGSGGVNEESGPSPPEGKRPKTEGSVDGDIGKAVYLVVLWGAL